MKMTLAILLQEKPIANTGSIIFGTTRHNHDPKRWARHL
jgi:hypothetical protein